LSYSNVDNTLEGYEIKPAFPFKDFSKLQLFSTKTILGEFCTVAQLVTRVKIFSA
jgi:hypothetical protein